MQKLKDQISRIDHKSYRAYKGIEGKYDFGDYYLYIDHVQGDPFASPSRLRARIFQDAGGFPGNLFSNMSRKIALEDFITRAFNKAISKRSKVSRGTGRSGSITIDCGGQEIMRRASCLVTREYVEIRFYAGLPARGRTILGSQCLEMLTVEIPAIINSSMQYNSLEKEKLKKFIEVSEDQDHLRRTLKDMGLISFIKNGSILPRKSGIDDCPLPAEEAIAFKSPPELEVSLDAPNIGRISGMGIPPGISLIIGGGFHGKTTLLKAIERGIYNHIPGDGREYVVTISSAVKIRAEEGRRMQKVNISPFISNLPFKKNTVEFSTINASGSTSQAANIIEALECDARLLLLDEDTSATNFLIRDEIMQKIIPRGKEPITPFIDQVKNIYKHLKASSILVMGGSGDYFEVSDTVIMMNDYLPYIVTDKARALIQKRKDKRAIEAREPFVSITSRIPIPTSIDPFRGRRINIKSRGTKNIVFGSSIIDLSAIEQIVDPSQVNSISGIILYALQKKYIDGKNTISVIFERVFEDIEKYGLDILSSYKDGHPGSHALPRKFEVAAAINRLRDLEVIQAP